MKKRYYSNDQEETDIPGETDEAEEPEPDEPEEPEEPEESDEPDEFEESEFEELDEDEKWPDEENRNRHEIFVIRACNATNKKLYIYRVCGGRTIRGRSFADLVQDAFVEYLKRRKVSEINLMRKAVLKGILNRIRNDLQRTLNSKENKIVKRVPPDTLADPNLPQQRRLAEKEIRRIQTMLLDQFLSELPLNKRRAIRVIAKADISAMIQLRTPKYKKVLRCLVKLRLLNKDYSRAKMSFYLHRPVQLLEKLPEEYRALSHGIFHILKGDKYAKNRYLAGKLKISYRNAKILCNNLRNDFLDFLTKELKNKKGILSVLTDIDKMEVLGNWNNKRSS